MERSRVRLFLDASAASSGSGPTYVRNVVPHLASRDDVQVTVLLSPELRLEFQDSKTVSFVGFKAAGGNAGLRFWQAQRFLPGLIRQSGADILISAGNFALFRSPVPQILLSGNALYTSAEFLRDVRSRGHYGLWLDTRVKAWFARRSVRCADCTIAPTRAFADELERWTGVPVRAVHHGFDRDLFFREQAPLPASLATALQRTNDELRLLFVSHYNYYRNFETLFRAVAILKKKWGGRDFKLYLTCKLQSGANPGSYRTDRAARLADELGVTSDIVQLDAVPYALLHHVYKACDIYVTPAYVETFAHPLVEAMASGIPVVASDLAVHQEVCGDAAVYFPAFSPESLAKRLLEVVQTANRAEDLSKRGLLRAQDFSWKVHVDKIVAAAREIVKSGH